jgi:hypothetical protein
MPVVLAHLIFGVAGRIEEPRQLLVIDYQAVLGLAGAAMPAGAAEDVGAASWLKLDSAVQTLTHGCSGAGSIKQFW